jgi:hypothetical protein
VHADRGGLLSAPDEVDCPMFKPLGPETLYRRCDPQDLGFETSEELAELDEAPCAILLVR